MAFAKLGRAMRRENEFLLPSYDRAVTSEDARY
jgi:hypothetical protein